jgi:cytoskeletal protein CcmA (bactofilin family)
MMTTSGRDRAEKCPAKDGADAISVDGSATGVTIDNSGIIFADGGGYAITLDALSLGTSITNQAGAIISASTTAINYDGDLDGSLTNAGTIEITNTSSGTAIYVSGDVSGTITNSGTINFIEPSSGEFSGIYVGGDVSGTITNSGLISIEGTRGYSDT